MNYLSHLLLVLKLLPVMKQSVNPADARVIFVSSRMERWRGEFNLANIQGQLSYDRTKFYSMSKLYMVRIIPFSKFSTLSCFKKPGYTCQGITECYLICTTTVELCKMAAMHQWKGWLRHTALVYNVLILDIHGRLWSIDTYQNKASTDQYQMTTSQHEDRPHTLLGTWNKIIFTSI